MLDLKQHSDIITLLESYSEFLMKEGVRVKLTTRRIKALNNLVNKTRYGKH